MSTTSENIREQLDKLVEWHRQQAEHPIDVSGSDRARARRVRFHADAAKCIELLIAAVRDDALAFIDAADELYSSFCDSKEVDKRQRSALDDFASASNRWTQHPRKSLT